MVDFPVKFVEDVFTDIQREEVIGVGLKCCRSTVAKFYHMYDVVLSASTKAFSGWLTRITLHLATENVNQGSGSLCAICFGVLPSAGFTRVSPFPACTQIAAVPLEQAVSFEIVREPFFELPGLGETIGALCAGRLSFCTGASSTDAGRKGT